MRYKTIKDNYCHFVFQGFRVESVRDGEETITCIAKIGSPRLSNNTYCFKDIIYITDLNNEVVYSQKLYDNVKASLFHYIKSYKKLRNIKIKDRRVN